ncbi:hypothetical protein [Mucilaginibacter sp. PAMB04168]|uniref:hypothetical protein n=1 Tax=Mucilaginibacter sp. PAMB04168 TaxID=3138567 RepID=UPI0031F6F0DF
MLPPGTPYFDGDIKFSSLKKTFYDLDDALLWEALNEQHFPDWRQAQIASRHDTAFETNFRDVGVMTSIAEFTSAGYESRLVFMGLDSVEASIERVKLRVAKGGHDVPIEYININFKESLRNLDRFYDRFNSVHIYQNFQSAGFEYHITPLITLKAGKVTERAKDLPDWAIHFLRNTGN